MTDQTHYRKAFNSPYLSAADIVGPTKLTVKCVRLEIDKSKKTKDFFNTAYFVECEIRQGEPLKPMILNVGNSKIMKSFAGTPFIEEWNNMPITVFVDSNVRFGRDTVEGLRISPEQPAVEKNELTPHLATAWINAVEAYKRDGNLDAVLERMNISEANRALIKEQAKA